MLQTKAGPSCFLSDPTRMKQRDPLSSTHYVYSRETADEKLLVVCSFSDKVTSLKIPAGFNLSTAELILTNYDNPTEKLQPYESRVYLWKR